MDIIAATYGILAFFLIVLVGIALVSVHYRSEYEKTKIKYNKLKLSVQRFKDLECEMDTIGGNKNVNPNNNSSGNNWCFN